MEALTLKLAWRAKAVNLILCQVFIEPSSALIKKVLQIATHSVIDPGH